MKIKKIVKDTELGVLAINIKRIIFQKINQIMFDDETAIKRIYKKRLGRELDLDNPERFTEKLQWEKLIYRNPIMTTCVDKIAVRQFLTEKGYHEYLMLIVGTYRSLKT